MVTLLAFALGTATAQTAADWSIYPDVLLTGADVPYGSTIGSPSVIYDSVSDRYIMFFETFMASSATCPAGEWGIGIAFSNDGLSWTVSNNPLIDPDPTAATPTYYSCVAAHPGALYIPPSAGGAAGGTVYVYFKAEQASDACDSATPSWGCGQYTGVGSLRVRLRANGSILSTGFSPTPVLPKSNNFGYPKPMRYGNTIAISYTEYPNVMLATASIPQGPFAEQGIALDITDPQVTPLTWVEDEFYNAAIACEDSGAFPLKMFVGGRDNDFGIALDGGVGIAVAQPADITAWTLDEEPQFAFVGANDFRHWDVLRVDANDYLFYYDERDGSGNNQVRLASTLASFSWTNTSVYAKYCP